MEKKVIRLKESQLKQLVTETVKKLIKEDGVLLPRGGDIGGEHKKPMSDKQWDSYQGKSGETTRGFNTKKNRWEERFENYFGTKDTDLVYEFLENFKRLKPEDVKYIDITRLYGRFKTIIDALNIKSGSDILKNYNTYKTEFNLLSPSKENNWFQD